MKARAHRSQRKSERIAKARRNCEAFNASWDDIKGIAPNITGDKSSEEFVRDLRDEWEDR